MNNSIGRDGVKALAESFKKCRNLQILNLSMNNFGSAEIQTLSLGLKDCPSLVELYLTDNKIEHDGVQALSSCFLLCSNLKVLDLSNNVIAEADVLADSLKHCTKLNWLNLSGNLLDRKAAVKIISGINQCSSFRKLNILL